MSPNHQCQFTEGNINIDRNQCPDLILSTSTTGLLTERDIQTINQPIKTYLYSVASHERTRDNSRQWLPEMFLKQFVFRRSWRHFGKTSARPVACRSVCTVRWSIVVKLLGIELGFRNDDQRTCTLYVTWRSRFVHAVRETSTSSFGYASPRSVIPALAERLLIASKAISTYVRFNDR